MLRHHQWCRVAVCWLWLLLTGSLNQAAWAADSPTIPSALFDYVAKPESAFEWAMGRKQQTEGGVVYELTLTSQTWQDIVWKHALQVYEPKEVKFPKHVLLLVTGGSNGRRPGDNDVKLGLELARLCGARVATLHQVPNQPLFDGRKEDDLITETWLRFLETGDTNWPLLFPMVKSAVKAMDALEAFTKSTCQQTLEGFVITGGSKRGWTSWLTPVVDRRVLATAPMVIDVLNFRPQMQYQLDTWGKYSEQIEDYTGKGLIKQGDETPREEQLRLMMDPFTYRSRLSLPKLLITGTNDRYWVVDAMKFYWDDLIGPKFTLHVPNAGHDLGPGRELVFRTIAAFFHHVATQTPLPTIGWERSDSTAQFVVRIKSSVRPRHGRLWTAHSDTKDFREAKWASTPIDLSADPILATIEKPSAGHIAFFGELQFEVSRLPYSLCTLTWRE